MAFKPDEPVLAFASPAKWATWLAKHHETSKGLWLQIAKKGAEVSSVSYAEALEVALCFGWIDGQKKKLDDQHWLQRFTPRTARSPWSKINRAKAEALLEKGEMRPAGVAEVERAKADGRWDKAYAGQRTAAVPADLKRVLDENQAAREFFEALDSANRYAILYRIEEAKKPETRERRIEKYVAMCAEGKKVHP
jgi:uncharacterized protein YdeI (YjbR/CyaY-like superfamily)